ncbi:hypothetical protein ACOI1H_16700 [Loktanella sp. DJP18]|uniref:hypothetical protein n=1 Tax=Loktanella sp. DJP18 TaxID=3409788 RepID=UPI003BB61977
MKIKTTTVKNGLDILTLASAVAIILMQASPAFAATAATAGSDGIFTKSCTMLWNLKKWLFGVVYVLGAIGMVLIAVSAFLGRFKFAHLISLGGGLFIVAMSDLLIQWLVSSGSKDQADGCKQ